MRSEMGPDMGDKERGEVAKNITHSAYQITSLVNKMLAIANDSSKDLMAQATETDGVAICCKAIENMPVVDAEKVKVKLDNQTNGNVMLYTNGDSLLPSDKVGTIFQRWVKADEFTEGLGLGLAYCWETAQKLGGELTLDQTSEAGTTFTLSLPVEKTND